MTIFASYYSEIIKLGIIMKKIIVTLAAIVLGAACAFAQDMSQATETAKIANEALSTGDYDTALSGFKEALTMAEACGDDGLELVGTCKSAIAKVMNAVANKVLSEGKYDEAIAKFKEVVEVAAAYGEDDIVAKATTKIPQIMMQKANSLLNAKDFAGAADAYKAVLDNDPANGMVALRLGQALAGAGKVADAKEAFKTAAANGQEKNANKQLGNIALKEAAAALKTKNYPAAVAAAVESNEYAESAQAIQIAAQASQLQGKNDDAIKYFEKYLEVAPTAKNAGQIAYTVGALYQQAKNNAKAKEFYTKAATDPTYGAEAQKLLNALK